MQTEMQTVTTQIEEQSDLGLLLEEQSDLGQLLEEQSDLGLHLLCLYPSVAMFRRAMFSLPMLHAIQSTLTIFHEIVTVSQY